MSFFRYIGTEVRDHFHLGTLRPGHVVEADEIDTTHQDVFEPVSDKEGKAAVAAQAEAEQTVEPEPAPADDTSEPAAPPAADQPEPAAEPAQE